MKKLIVLVFTILPICYASALMTKNECVNRTYSNLDRSGKPQRNLFCAGKMKLTESGALISGRKTDVKVVLSDDSSPGCSHIDSILVTETIKAFFDAQKESEYSFRTCLMPRLFDANASPNTGIFIGDDNFYNPRIANQNLLISSLKNTSVLRKLHQARLAARGINLPADNEKCSFKDDKDSTKWERIRMKMGFYDNISKDTKDRIAAGTSTCNDILDSLSYPTDLFPNEIEKCSKNTLLCTTTSTVPTMKKPFNPILKVVTPILFAEKKIDQGKFGELKETFTINEFLNTLVDPYYDQLDFNDKDGVSIIYKQTDLNGNFRK